MRNFFKNINKFGLVAILLAGTSAFAFRAPARAHLKANETTYFAIQSSPGHYTWATSLPEGSSCQSGNATCEISTSETPVDDNLPSSYTALDGTDGQSVNRP